MITSLKCAIHTFVPILILNTCSSIANAQQNLPTAYLLIGEITSTSTLGVGFDGAPDLRPTDILVARSPDRILVASRRRDPPSERYYLVAFRGMSHAILIQTSERSTWTEVNNLRNSEGLLLHSIARQYEVAEDSDCGIQAASETGILSRAALCVFFGRGTAGHNSSDYIINRTAQSQELISNEFGTLTLNLKDNHHTLSFIKNSDNLLDIGDIRGRLREGKSGTFKEGLKTIEETCDFTISFDKLTNVPWDAKCLRRMVGGDGSVMETAITVRVHELLPDKLAVDRVIDELLERIPDGTDIITNEKLSYAWSGKNIRIVKDSSAMVAAEQVTFEAPSEGMGNRFTLGLIAILAVAAIVFMYTRQK